MTYLDIDDILCEEERLPCKFLADAPTLGHLDPNEAGSGKPLRAGSRIELPFWLAEILHRNEIIEIEVPKHFGAKMRDELRSSSALNLREFSHYFFDVGLKLSHITKDDDLLSTLRSAISGDRFKSLLSHSLTTYYDDLAEYSQTLTNTEMNIINEAVLVSKSLHKWRSRQLHKLEAAPILSKKVMINTENTGPAVKKSRQ